MKESTGNTCALKTKNDKHHFEILKMSNIAIEILKSYWRIG